MRYFAFTTCFVLFTIFGSLALADDQAEYDYREEHGAANAIWMNGLLKDYHDGTLSESDLMAELWAERPGAMSAFYAFHGQFNVCFEIDLVAAETNGVKSEQGGVRVFYDTSVYLDANGNVISGYERTYNNAVTANSILNDVYDQYTTSNCPACPANNQCCQENPTGPISCVTKPTLRCCNQNPQTYACTGTNGNGCP